MIRLQRPEDFLRPMRAMVEERLTKLPPVSDEEWRRAFGLESDAPHS